MAEVKYSGVNKGEDNRYKINNNILRMMQANPALGTGYIIGSMLGENYWGKKRAKTRQETKDKFFGNQNGSVGADANGVYGTTNSTTKEPNYYDNMNKALDEYKNTPNGRVLYSGSGNNSSNSNPGVYIDTAKGIYPQTPQQANKPAVTTENAGNGGGVPGVMDAWNNMNNASMYNAGNTAMYTNGARNLGNVIGADANGVYGVNSVPIIGADANGVYGVTPASSAPSVANFPQKPANGPAPYTDDQLRQIQGQNFTAEELAKMASPQELARMVVMARGGAAPTGGGVLTSAAERYAPATPVVPAAPQTPANIDKIIAGDDEIYERGNPFANQSTPLPVSHRGTRAMAAAWQQDPNIMNAASSTPAPQLVYPNEVDPRLLELAANQQYGDR